MKTIEEQAKIMYDDAKNIGAFINGAEFAQRWIPVEEELPPIDIDVILKYRYSNRTYYWVGTIHTIERLEHFLNKHLLFTHWRPIEYR